MEKILFVADPLHTLKPEGDTSLCLAEAALRNGWRVDWCVPGDIGVLGRDVVVGASQVLRSVDTRGVEADERVVGVEGLDGYRAVFVRKDPPFDEAYKDLCWILAAQHKTPVLNAAEALLAFHEKALHLRAASEGVLTDHALIPTCVASSLALVEEFCAQQVRHASGFLAAFDGVPALAGAKLRFLTKPWLGHGGQGVRVHETPADVLAHLKSAALSDGTFPERIIVQPYLPEIHTEGDRRIIVAGGKVVCDFVRVPAQGKVASNLAQGGTAILRPMTDVQMNIATRLAQYLLSKNITFAGIDMIGDRIGEINITSPTGLRTYEALSGTSKADEVFFTLLSSVGVPARPHPTHR